MIEETNIEYVARFEEFLKGYQDLDGSHKYRELIKDMSLSGRLSLVVNYSDLLRYDPELARNLIDHPKEVIDAASNALKNVLSIVDKDYAESKEKFYVRFRGLTTTIPLRKLRASHVGKLIQVSGILTRASQVKPLLIKGTFKCPHCGTLMVRPQPEGKLNPPAVCENPSCRRKGPFPLVEELSEFVDWQHIRIQERPEELPPGQLPRFIDARLSADMVDIARPGDRVVVTGVYKARPDTTTPGKLATFSTFVEVNYIDTEEKEVESIEITPEEEEEIRNLAKDKLVANKIVNSIAPSIYGHKRIKEAIALMLFGGVPKVLPDGVQIRGEINVLLVGDPGTGKSQMLKYVTRIAPRAVYTTGKGSTAAGLTAAVVKDSVSGGMTLEAGALVLADRGIACIDEFDKMRKEDRGAIHEAMEQHTISIAKGGIVATLNARASVLAAANPVFGRYDIYKTATENLNLPATILSRFDLIFVVTDRPDMKQDAQLIQHVLNLHMAPDEKAEGVLDTAFLKKYIAYARRNVRPKLTPEASKEIQDFYLKMRAKSTASSVAITTRQLEALVRLAEARAKMELRNTVEKSDAQFAINLMLYSLKQVAFDETTESIDIDRILVGKPRTQLEMIQRVYEIISELEAGKDEAVAITQVIQTAEGEGIPRDIAKKAIDHLKNEGMIFEPRNGYVKRA
mgnify:CR=1 FL=1